MAARNAIPATHIQLTVNVDTEIYEAVRRKAYTERTTNRKVVEDALRIALANYLATGDATS
jgi:hypothetical protein